MTYLRVVDARAHFGVSFSLRSFPAMIRQHGENFADTLTMERDYAHLIDEPFEDYQTVAGYVRAVCRWGNYAGIGGKVLRNNSKRKILGAFEAARRALRQNQPDLQAALTSLNRLHGLGSTSFASKHLRFLRPEWCPVYDRILNDVLPYNAKPAGYAQFANDCRAIAQELCARNIRNPVRDNAVTWYVSDVEAAIFSEVRRARAGDRSN